MTKNEYFIYSKKDVIQLLELNRPLYINNTRITGKIVFEAQGYVTQIAYVPKKELYKWTTNYRGILTAYFYLDVNKTIDLLFQKRKLYNATQKYLDF